MSTYAKRRPAVTSGDEIAADALRLLGKVDISRLSAPRIFVNDMLAIATRLYEEANGRRQAE